VWQALQHAAWVETIAVSRGLYGLLLVVHYCGLFVCVGAIILLDLSILGAANRNRPLPALARQLRPWTWNGFGASVVSGFLLFTTKAGSYVTATPFLVKLSIVGVAVFAAVIVERRVPKWDQARAVPVPARLLALISIVLWLAAILAGVEVPALTGLG
jgi:hypothetical protein